MFNAKKMNKEVLTIKTKNGWNILEEKIKIKIKSINVKNVIKIQIKI